VKGGLDFGTIESSVILASLLAMLVVYTSFRDSQKAFQQKNQA
jgi:uncharacterized membrane-anchored protein